MDAETRKVINDTYRCDHCNSRPKKQEPLLETIHAHLKPDLILCYKCSAKFDIISERGRWVRWLHNPDDYDKVKQWDRNKKII